MIIEMKMRKPKPLDSKRSSLKILVLIPTLKDDPTQTVQSVKRQTMPVSKIMIIVGSKQLYSRLKRSELAKIAEIIYFRPNMKEPLGLRVAKSLNHALSMVKVENYDYILRVDADVKLPRKFIEENMKANADIVGRAGYAMLIKNQTFLQILKGRFPEVPAEDSYMNYKFWASSKKVENWKIYPTLLQQSVRKHFWREKFRSGLEAYKLGYEPIHVVARLRLAPLKNTFFCLGYFYALLGHFQKYEFAARIFNFQIKRLFSALGSMLV